MPNLCIIIAREFLQLNTVRVRIENLQKHLHLTSGKYHELLHGQLIPGMAASVNHIESRAR